MYRNALSLLLVLGSSISALSAPASNSRSPTAGPTVEEIKKAIEDLGNQRFAVREKAKKFLQQAGEAAEPFLLQATKSPDDEVASSAKAILEDFQWGLYPDTPQPVRELVDRYRAGTMEQRQGAMSGLLNIKPVPYATIRKLLAKEQDAAVRQHLTQYVDRMARDSIPRLLRTGDYDAVQALLELTLSGAPGLAAADYAVFMHLRGKIDEAIQRFEKERSIGGEKGEQAAEVLVYLYRIKQDWSSARKAAEDARKTAQGDVKHELVELVLWQSGDWKALAAQPSGAEAAISGLNLAYDRLAGNKKAFNEKIEELLKIAEDDMNPSLARDVDALMLNGKAAEAIKILAEKKKEMGLTFDLLCTQMKHKEAFALVDEARRRDTNPAERIKINIRRARMLYLLGERDAAKQLFRELATEIKLHDRDKINEHSGRHEKDELIESLVKTEVRFPDLRDDADTHAAEGIEQLIEVGADSLLEPLFGDEKDLARAWWNLFRKESPKENPDRKESPKEEPDRKESPKEDPVKSMKRVRDILSGKLDKDKEKNKALVEEWAGKMQKVPKADPDELRVRGRERPRGPAFSAIAAAYRAIGDDARTEEFLRKAAQAGHTMEGWIAHGDFLMAQKKYKAAAESYAKAANAKSKRDAASSEIGEDDDALVLLEPGSGPALPIYLQGRALVAGGDVKEGKRLIEQAHWIPLGDEKVRAKLYDELNKRDWPEMAHKEAEMLVRTGWYRDYTYGNVLSYLARQAAKDKDFHKAAEFYEKCIVGCMRTGAHFIESSAYLVVPESIRAYQARALISRGKIDEGLKEASASLDVMPGNVDLAIKLVPELEKAGKKKEAAALYDTVRGSYEKLAKEFPGSAFARNSAAWLMANCRRDLDDALKHATKAVELEPKNSGYIDTLAEVNFRKGNRDKALELMKQCVELDKKNSYFKRQLARFKDQSFDSPTPEEEDGED